MKVGRDEEDEDDKDDLSRFNSSSEENDDDDDDGEDDDASGTPSGVPRVRVGSKNAKSDDWDDDVVGNTHKRKRLNAAERKRLKKKETQHIKAERRKRERERLEKANKEGEEEEEEEEKTAKTKKKKKKKKKANATDGDGGDVIETDEEKDETTTRNTKKYHHTFEVEGVILQDGTLVLVDKRSLAVYSSEEREGNGEHKRIGTWDAATKTVKRNDNVDIANNGSSSSSSISSSSISSDDDEDDDDDTKSPSSDDSEDETKQQQQQTEPIKLDINHAFECNLDDHCETSLEAHKDIVNFLNIAASQKSKKPSELVIYDPYYCAGATKMNFAELGFPNVINENKDFYELVAKNEVPKHDVFVTNPPYSEEHVEKCVTFAAKNMTEFGRPYFMLVPSYVVCKPYFVPALLTGGTRGAEERKNKEDTTKDEMNMHKKRGQVLPFYIAPTKRYYYFTPKPLAKLRNKNIAENGIEKKRRVHVGRRGERTSPFLSLWICGFGEDQVEALRLHKKLRREQVKHYVVARNPKEIPLNVLDEWDPRRRTESGAHDKMKNKKK